jgi:maltose alpha-D-glucosyltransferase/alpha-amylase
VSYLSGYFDVTRQSGLLPKTREELDLLMNILLLDKAIYELRYELDNRPDWVAVPIEGILELIKTKAAVSGQ